MKAEGGAIQAANLGNAVNVCTLWNVYYFKIISLCQTIKENETFVRVIHPNLFHVHINTCTY